MKNSTSTSYHLDPLDKEIIYMLMDSAKSSLAYISKQVGISEKVLAKCGLKMTE